MLNEDHDYENDPFAVEAVFSFGSVWGHFTEATEAVSMYTGEIEAHDTSFSCNASEVQAVKNGMSVTIGGEVFEVKRKHKIGTGDSLIYLKT